MKNFFFVSEIAKIFLQIFQKRADHGLCRSSKLNKTKRDFLKLQQDFMAAVPNLFFFITHFWCDLGRSQPLHFGGLKNQPGGSGGEVGCCGEGVGKCGGRSGKVWGGLEKCGEVVGVWERCGTGIGPTPTHSPHPKHTFSLLSPHFPTPPHLSFTSLHTSPHPKTPQLSHHPYSSKFSIFPHVPPIFPISAIMPISPNIHLRTANALLLQNKAACK